MLSGHVLMAGRKRLLPIRTNIQKESLMFGLRACRSSKIALSLMHYPEGFCNLEKIDAIGSYLYYSCPDAPDVKPSHHPA